MCVCVCACACTYMHVCVSIFQMILHSPSVVHACVLQVNVLHLIFIKRSNDLIIGPSSASLSHTSHPSLLCTLSCPHNSFICPTFMLQHPDKVWDQPLLCALLNMGHTLVYSGNEPSRNWWTNFCLMALYSYWECVLWTKMT